MRVLTVVGARPQFVKLAPVSEALQRAAVDHVVIHTGQHFDDDMSAVFFRELGIQAPDRNLDIHSTSHGEMTGRMMEHLERVIVEERPDWVVVYGDTNSTLATALVTAKLPVRLAHVEAGLRSFNRVMPEEINRVVTDHISDLCLTPTVTADENLRREGVTPDAIVRTGDVMFDAVRLFADRAAERSTVLADWGLSDGEYVLATVHRAETTDDPGRLGGIADAFRSLATEVTVVLPLHPRTRNALAAAGCSLGGVKVLPPVGYLDMLSLERNARLVITDSGGVQKEAFFVGRPCVTLRTETEWVELVELGWNRLVPPTDAAAVLTGVRDALAAPPGRAAEPYGDATAAELVVRALLRA